MGPADFDGHADRHRRRFRLRVGARSFVASGYRAHSDGDGDSRHRALYRCFHSRSPEGRRRRGRPAGQCPWPGSVFLPVAVGRRIGDRRRRPACRAAAIHGALYSGVGRL